MWSKKSLWLKQKISYIEGQSHSLTFFLVDQDVQPLLGYRACLIIIIMFRLFLADTSVHKSTMPNSGTLSISLKYIHFMLSIPQMHFYIIKCPVIVLLVH